MWIDTFLLILSIVNEVGKTLIQFVFGVGLGYHSSLSSYFVYIPFLLSTLKLPQWLCYLRAMFHREFGNLTKNTRRFKSSPQGESINNICNSSDFQI